CPGPCPFMSSKMAELYQIYSNTDKVQFISISIDPNRDSLSVLKEYAEQFPVYVRRRMAEVVQVVKKFK
ncbi:MAG: SCO family protein, partial [Dehalococcoidia bacterium]|nr:SCO family protein [Dehalococcoidia bacterium]